MRGRQDLRCSRAAATGVAEGVCMSPSQACSVATAWVRSNIESLKERYGDFKVRKWVNAALADSLDTTGLTVPTSLSACSFIPVGPWESQSLSPEHARC